MPGEIAERARRLPVALIDDLLEVAADQRIEQLREARVETYRVEHRLMIRRPLDHPHQRLAAVMLTRDIVEQVAVAETAAVRRALRIELVDGGAELAQLAWREQAAHHRIALAPVMRDISMDADRFISSQRLRSHDLSPRPTRRIQQLVDISINFQRQQQQYS